MKQNIFWHLILVLLGDIGTPPIRLRARCPSKGKVPIRYPLVRKVANDRMGVLRLGLLKQSLNLPRIVEADDVGGRHFRQAGHGHDVAGDDDDELGTGR